MNTTQTRPPAARPQPPSHTSSPALPPLARAILADWDNPAISELELAERHGLTLEALDLYTQTPAFRAALGSRRRLRDERRESYLHRAQDHAADILTALSNRPPDSATAAKEIRLALKELIRLRSLGAAHPESSTPKSLGSGAFQAPDRPQGDAGHAGDPEGGPDFQSAIPGRADFQSAARAQPEPPTPQPTQTLPTPTPRPTPHKPKRPRGTKPRPKPTSR